MFRSISTSCTLLAKETYQYVKNNRYYSTIHHHSKTISRNNNEVTAIPAPNNNMHSNSHAYSHSIHKIQQQTFQIFASTLPGFEQILSHELELKINISKQNQRIMKGGIEFYVTSVEQLYQCHLHLGTVSHLFLRVPVVTDNNNNNNNNNNSTSASSSIEDKISSTTFYAIHAKQLFQKVRKMSIWKELIPIPTSRSTSPKLDIRVTSVKSKLYHTKLIANCVEKGIHKALELDSLFHNTRTSSSSSSSSSDLEKKCISTTNDNNNYKSDSLNHNKIRILVRIDHDQVQISIDTSLSPLHKRGYKLDVRKAPLREDIAYAFLYSSGWSKSITDKNMLSSSSRTTKLQCLIDPFCGSGTILIEGAKIALGLPPGRLRPTPCQNTNLYNDKLWKNMITESTTQTFQQGVQQINLPLVIGSDRDEGAIQSTMANAKRAGVENYIQLHACSITSNPWLNNNSSLLQNYSNILVATNPPFGLRISPISSKKKRKIMNSTQTEVATSLLPLYQSLGNIIRDLQKKYDNKESGVGNKKCCVNMAIISHDIDLARKTGVSNLKKKFTTQLGGISVSALGSYSLGYKNKKY